MKRGVAPVSMTDDLGRIGNKIGVQEPAVFVVGHDPQVAGVE